MKGNLATGIILLLVTVILVGWSVFSSNKSQVSQQQSTTQLTQIQQVLSPYSAKDEMQKLVVFTNVKNSTSGNTPTYQAKANIRVTGTIAAGYLFVEASAGGQSLSTSGNFFDDVYADLVEESLSNTVQTNYGGHLVESRSLPTPQDSSTSTQMLFDISNVPYLKTYTDSDKEVTSGNWLQILNDSSSKKLISFSSTLKQGVIEELTIYYQCADNSSCSISTY